MKIEAKNINKHSEFLNRLQNILRQYEYMPTSRSLELEQNVKYLCKQYFCENEPFYELKPYIFLKSYVDIITDLYSDSINIAINGYDLYTNNKNEVILVYIKNNQEFEENAGNFSKYIKNFDSQPYYECALAIKQKLISENKKDEIIKQTYNLRPTKKIKFSNSELFHIYNSLKVALGERIDTLDNELCNRILSYLYGNNLLILDEHLYLKIRKISKRGGINVKNNNR